MNVSAADTNPPTPAHTWPSAQPPRSPCPQLSSAWCPYAYSDMAFSSARNAASVRVKPHRLHSSGSPPGRGATVPKQSGWGHVYLGTPHRPEPDAGATVVAHRGCPCCSTSQPGTLRTG